MASGPMRPPAAERPAAVLGHVHPDLAGHEVVVRQVDPRLLRGLAGRDVGVGPLPVDEEGRREVGIADVVVPFCGQVAVVEGLVDVALEVLSGSSLRVQVTLYTAPEASTLTVVSPDRRRRARPRPRPAAGPRAGEVHAAVTGPRRVEHRILVTRPDRRSRVPSPPPRAATFETERQPWCLPGFLRAPGFAAPAADASAATSRADGGRRGHLRDTVGPPRREFLRADLFHDDDGLTCLDDVAGGHLDPVPTVRRRGRRCGSPSSWPRGCTPRRRRRPPGPPRP